jgi:hypothetical protein
MLGVTQPFRLEIARIECGSSAERVRIPASHVAAPMPAARSSVPASGCAASLPFVGDEVRLRIRAEARLKH